MLQFLFHRPSNTLSGEVGHNIKPMAWKDYEPQTRRSLRITLVVVLLVFGGLVALMCYDAKHPQKAVPKQHLGTF